MTSRFRKNALRIIVLFILIFSSRTIYYSVKSVQDINIGIIQNETQTFGLIDEVKKSENIDAVKQIAIEAIIKQKNQRNQIDEFSSSQIHLTIFLLISLIIGSIVFLIKLNNEKF